MKQSLYFGPLVLMMTAAAGFAPTLCGAGGAVAPTNKLTLEAAIQIALHDNPELRAAAGRVEAAVGRAWQLGRWSNPELELEVEEWPLSDGRSFSDAKQTIGVRQQLPWPTKKKYDREMGRTSTRLSESELALRKTEVVRDVNASFHRVLAAEASVHVGESLLRIAGSSADTAKKRVDSGAAPYQEQLRADTGPAHGKPEQEQLHVHHAGVQDIGQARPHTNAPLRRKGPHPVAVGHIHGCCRVWMEADQRFWVLLPGPLKLALLGVVHGHEPAARYENQWVFLVQCRITQGAMGHLSVNRKRFASQIFEGARP